ncbi:unnamed protein product, partial [Nesidiocoris tenuis]
MPIHELDDRQIFNSIPQFESLNVKLQNNEVGNFVVYTATNSLAYDTRGRTRRSYAT